jgi:geranylgeranyl diphosphate synthase type II
MTGKQMKSTLEAYRQRVEAYLQTCLKDDLIPEGLQSAMEYSLFAGGKRIRPVLCLAWTELLGGDGDGSLPFACALECIHTYSLIHDDLPAMDDDDMRRGQPSNHVKHGQAMAILAGDGLLTESFSLMLAPGSSPERTLQAAAEVARAAGPRGMVGGQVLDIAMTGKGEGDLDTLKSMHSLKTGAMLRASCLSGALLAGADQDDVSLAEQYGTAIGLAFQIADDILDITGNEQIMGKPVGSDVLSGKLTYPSLLGLERSQALGFEMVEKATGALEKYRGQQALFLSDLARYIMERTT